MADIWISAFKVMSREIWDDKFKKEIGEMVLKALYSKWHTNQEEFGDDDLVMQDLEYFIKSNSKYNTTITINTN